MVRLLKLWKVCDRGAHHELHPSIPFEAFDRIESLRGPGNKLPQP